MIRNIQLIILTASIIFSCKSETKSSDSASDSKDRNADTDMNIKFDSKTSSSASSNSESKINESTASKIPSKIPIKIDFTEEVNKFITCKKAATVRTDCRNSITKVISETYDIDEFKDPKQGYMVYDSIRPIVEKSKHWKKLGRLNQKHIDQAVNHTNKGGLALVIDTSNSYGHVVMMVAGELKKSGSWNMKLPNVVSLANHNPEKSFNGKSLSYAMKKSNDLKIYIRR